MRAWQVTQHAEPRDALRLMSDAELPEPGPGQLRPEHLVAHNYSIIGLVPSGYERSFKEQAQACLLGHWRAGKLRTVVHEVVRFEQLPRAVELVGG